MSATETGFDISSEIKVVPDVDSAINEAYAPSRPPRRSPSRMRNVMRSTLAAGALLSGVIGIKARDYIFPPNPSGVVSASE